MNKKSNTESNKESNTESNKETDEKLIEVISPKNDESTIDWYDQKKF